VSLGVWVTFACKLEWDSSFFMLSLSISRQRFSRFLSFYYFVTLSLYFISIDCYFPFKSLKSSHLLCFVQDAEYWIGWKVVLCSKWMMQLADRIICTDAQGK
jgi:hypothetical protein